MNELNRAEAKARILKEVEEKLHRSFGITFDDATPMQLYKAVALTVRDEVMERWTRGREERVEQKLKRLYYLSVEFLPGKMLVNHLLNLVEFDLYQEALSEVGVNLMELEKEEPEPGLGNGGLGRLASCFMESLATLQLPAMGCSIRYEYGLFRQQIVDGQQVEAPDNWLEDGFVWEVPDYDDEMEIHFGGHIIEDWSEGYLKVRHEDYSTVLALPYDVPVSGYDSDIALSMRLWSARSPRRINMEQFSRGDYIKASAEKELAEAISKVLYPDDNHLEGKELRLKQHYFFTSATIQYAVKDFKRRFPELPITRLADKVAIHINDTHPALAILELMRVLLDQEGLPWETAIAVCSKVFAYTNHTIMNEALETWSEDLFKVLLPRLYSIVQAINQDFCEALWKHYPGQFDRIARMAIVSYGQIHMANLAVAMSHAVNGVSKLHTRILKQDLFADFYRIYPGRFHAITNGISYRRWSLKANPGLAHLITEAIGPGWLRDAAELEKLRPMAEDAAFLEKAAAIKKENKVRLAHYVERTQGIVLSPDSIYDVQAKRLHEYKRQLLNALHILYLYQQIKANPEADYTPRTFLFAAKAAPGYYRAKLIINFICQVAELVHNDPDVKGRLKVVFLPNYNVSLAEVLIPAAEVSEQISTAGKEASGTSNMKFMLNGAITLGTLDGANVEMLQAVGEENIIIFGMTPEEVQQAYRFNSYRQGELYEENLALRRVLDMMVDGSLTPANPHRFSELYQALLFSDNGGMADPYFVLKDFDAYAAAHKKVEALYGKPKVWQKKSVLNIAASGVFSSDKTIREYNRKVWHLSPVESEE